MKIDDLAIPVLCIAIGALRVVLQLVDGGAWGAEPTIAAIMLALGLLALVGLISHRRSGSRPRNGAST